MNGWKPSTLPPEQTPVLTPDPYHYRREGQPNYINSYNRNPIIQDGPENNLIQQCLPYYFKVRGSVQTAAN